MLKNFSDTYQKLYVAGLLFLMFVVCFGHSSCLFSQNSGLKLTVLAPDLSCDSIYLKNFDGKTFVNLQSEKYAAKTIFLSDSSLMPGLYLLAADSTIIAEILISDTLYQNFSIKLSDNEVTFKNSPENSANMAFQKEMNRMNMEMRALGEQFHKTQSSSLPDFSKQKTIDSLKTQAQLIIKQMEEKRQEMIRQYPDALIASLIKTTSEIPEPPESYYQNQMLMMQYQIEHFFDNYPFEDERLLNTPIAYEKINQYSAMLYQAAEFLPDSTVTKTLNKAKVSEKTYRKLFEILEKNLGEISSPFWTEDVYIEMLTNVIAYDKTDALKKQFYQMQLKRFDKNRKGSLIPDFELMFPDGSTKSIYSIESEYTLLYFQNPDCPTCIKAREQLYKMESLNQAIDSKKIKVITVYFEKDEQLWRRYLRENANPRYINTWEFQNKIETKELFELSVIPYMFLLDKDKRVIVKDLQINQLESFLQNIR